MNRHDMREWLTALDKGNRYPMWIISYSRPGSAPWLSVVNRFERTDDVHVLVRESQTAQYAAAYPALNIHGLPDDQIPSCGSARWGAADLAHAFGEEAVLMFDDDVMRIRFLFERQIQSGVNAGQASSGCATSEDDAALPDLMERVCTGMSDVARQVFKEEPLAVLGGMLKRHGSFNPGNSRTQFVVNGAVTPRQAMVWHLDRLHDAGVRLNMDDFGVTGEDLGIVAEVLRRGLHCFAMPSFVYDHWPEDVNIKRSTIRNAGNAAALHAHEWEALQRYPIKDYLRVKRSIIDGSYQWGDVNWRELHKLRGTQARRVPWPLDDLL